MSGDLEIDARILSVCKRLNIETDSDTFPRVIPLDAWEAICDRLEALEAQQQMRNLIG